MRKVPFQVKDSDTSHLATMLSHLRTFNNLHAYELSLSRLCKPPLDPFPNIGRSTLPKSIPPPRGEEGRDLGGASWESAPNFWALRPREWIKVFCAFPPNLSHHHTHATLAAPFFGHGSPINAARAPFRKFSRAEIYAFF